MSAMDVDQLLAPISEDAPCGENLEYDASYAVMEQAAAGKPEQQFGSTVIPAEEPDWREVQNHALEVLSRSKDLRAAVYLCRALVRNQGATGLRDGLALVRGMVEKYWPNLHPQLDPDDDNDPTIRVNTIASLADGNSLVHRVREMPLVQCKGFGPVSYRDVQVAMGELPPPPDTTKPQMSSIDGALAECDLALLQTATTIAKESLENVTAIEDAVTDQVGASSAPNLEELSNLLTAITKFLNQRLERRGVSEPAETPAAEETSPAKADGDASPRSAPVPQRLAGEITSREDVIRALDKICDYYARFEPSSPLPLLLKRAKRLAAKSFLEILRDLTPDAVMQALSIGGITDGEADSSQSTNDDL